MAQRAHRSIRRLAEAPPYPVAVQLAAVARELERLGERQVARLDDVARRFSADLTRLGQLLPANAAPAPHADRVAVLVEKRWEAMRLAVFSLAGTLVLGTLAGWLLGTTIGDAGPSVGLLPGPLAALRRANEPGV